MKQSSKCISRANCHLKDCKEGERKKKTRGQITTLEQGWTKVRRCMWELCREFAKGWAVFYGTFALKFSMGPWLCRGDGARRVGNTSFWIEDI